MPAAGALAAIPFFAEVLGADDLEAIAARAVTVRKPAGAVLIREDDSTASVFIIVTGRVSVTAGTGRESRHVATLGPGDIVGEMSLLTGARRSATVTAAEPVSVLEIDHLALRPLLDRNPGLVERFAAMLAERQKEIDRLYGHGGLRLFGSGPADFGGLIRRFFGSGF